MSADTRDGAGGRRWGAALAALLLLALIACFFSTPLSKYATHSYTAADMTQDYTLTRVEAGHVPGNRLLSDPVTEMVPWLLYNRDELRAGRVPLWNDRNALGAPHLANFQSAVFSPFSVPFYVLDLKAALLASAFLKLGAVALFSFLFLARLGLGSLACAIGAAIFTFCGHNVLLLAYPHSAAVVVLPAGLFFAELALSRAERGRGVFGACAGLAATFGIGLLCGQPEPYYFSVLVVALWCAGRLAAIAWREWLDRGTAYGALGLAARLLLAAAVGACIGAPQVLPFLEYLEHSTILVWRSADQTPLNAITWPLYAFPDLLGNPAREYHLNYAIPPPNYESANTCYVGAFAMVAAASVAPFLRRSGAARFFFALAVVWFLYAYDVLGMAKLAGWIPTLGLAPINRSQPVGAFALSACAAIAVHAVATHASSARWKWALATLLAGSSAMWFTLVFDRPGEPRTFRGAWPLFNRLLNSGYSKGMPKGSEAYVPEHVQFIVATFALGLLALVALWFARPKWLKVPLQLAVLAAVFLQSGWLLRDYNPTVADRFVYPRTPSVERLRELARGEPVLVLGADTLPPHTNSVYGIRSLSSYDAMWIRKFDELYRESFGLGGGNWRLALQTTTRWARQFGARLIASPGTWIKADSFGDEILLSPTDLYTTPPILPGQDCVQTFLAGRERLQGISLQFAAPSPPAECTIEAKLEDTVSGLVVATRRWNTKNWGNDRFGRHEELFHFPALIDARHRLLRLTVSSPDAAPGRAAALWAREDYWYWNQFVLLDQPVADVVWNLEPALRRPGPRPHGQLTVGGRVLEGGLLLDQTSELEAWRALEAIPGFTIGELADPLPRYSTVSRAIAARTVGDDFHLTHESNLDSRSVVVLSYPPGKPIDSTRSQGPLVEPEVAVLRDDSDRVELEVERNLPGYLVMRRALFPGWEARVNGERAALLRADYAFCAVELGTGKSRVELVYRPASFRAGLWIAALAPLLGGALFFATRRRGRIVPRAA